MRHLLILALLTAALSPAAAENTKTIRFWQFWSEEWIKPSVAEFEKQNPGVKVEIERLTWDQGFNKIVTAMAANDAPDVLEIGSTWVASLGYEGGLREVKPGKLLAKYGSWVVFDGKYHAYPWTTSTTALFYNKKLLSRAGVADLPKDWDALLLASQKIRATGKSTYGYGVKTGEYSTWQKFLPFAWSNGTRLLNPDGKSTSVGDPAFLESVKFYQKLAKAGLVDENLNVRKAFLEGKVGFVLDDPGQIKKFRKENPSLDFGVMKLPPAPKTGESINFSGAQMLAISKNAKHPVEAEKFIHFMIRSENAKAITTRITTLFPAEKAAIEDDFYRKDHPELLVFIDTLSTAISPVAHPAWTDIQSSFRNQLEAVLLDVSTPEEALETAEEEIREILEEHAE